MRILSSALTALVLVACAASSSPAPPPAASGASAANPAIIELYQSQGCSSCPPALAVLDRLADRPDVLALNFAVTYWDRLGWKDRFAQPAFTARQWEYARAAGRPNVQTPQLIVNGRGAVLGSREGEVVAALATYRRPAEAPAIAVTGATVSIGGGRHGRATVWVVEYDPRRVPVPIGSGENSGRTLVHRNIVTSLTALGTWTGAPLRLTLPVEKAGQSRAVLVQASSGGPILSAARA